MKELIKIEFYALSRASTIASVHPPFRLKYTQTEGKEAVGAARRRCDAKNTRTTKCLKRDGIIGILS